jgi:hypothetical protein
MRVRIRRFSSVELEYVQQPGKTERLEAIGSADCKAGLSARRQGPWGLPAVLCREGMPDVPLA